MSDDDDDEIYVEPALPARLAISFQSTSRKVWQRHKLWAKRLFVALVLILYSVYMAIAVQHSLSGSVPLIVMTLLALVYAFYRLLDRYLLVRLYPKWRLLWEESRLEKWWSYGRWWVDGPTLEYINPFG